MTALSGYKYNILQRTKKFSFRIILISSKLPKNPAGFTLSDQLVRAGTSIGANLIEAQEAVSSKDFLHKISISLKEAKETLYWIELINDAGLLPPDELVPLLKENDEIIRILVATSKKLKANNIIRNS